jgi:hypothetical protein
LKRPDQYVERESNERMDFVDLVLREYLFYMALLHKMPGSISPHLRLAVHQVDEYEASDIEPVPL